MDAVRVARELFDAYAGRDMGAVAALYDEDAIHTEIASGRGKTGPDAIVAGLEYFLRAFPDAEWRVDSLIADGGRAAVAYELRGTLTERMGHIEPAGQALSIRGVMVLETVGGHITRSDDYWDFASFQRQLVDPTQSAAPEAAATSVPSSARRCD